MPKNKNRFPNENGQTGVLEPGPTPDARNNQDRCAELAALGIVLPADASAADETVGQESRKRTDRSVGHAGTGRANRGVMHANTDASPSARWFDYVSGQENFTVGSVL